MCSAIYGDVCAIRLAERLLRQADDLWMLGERTPSLCEAPSLERGKRPTKECSRLQDDTPFSCRDLSPTSGSEIRMNTALVLRTANAAPVWRGGMHCFCTRSGGKNWIQTSAELY